MGDLTLREEGSPVDEDGLSQVIEAVLAEVGGAVPAAVVERCVASEAARFEAARIRAFVPILLRRAAIERVRSIQQAVSTPAAEGPAFAAPEGSSTASDGITAA